MAGLEEMIANLRALDGMVERATRYAAEELERAIKKTAAAGTTPDGVPWAPTKKGKRAMRNAAAHVSASAVGRDVIRVKLEGDDVFHHFAARGEVRRQVIPDGGGETPAIVRTAIEAGADRAFGEIMGGGK